MIALTIICMLWIAWKLGKEDGKWGFLIGLDFLVLIGLISVALK